MTRSLVPALRVVSVVATERNAVVHALTCAGFVEQKGHTFAASPASNHEMHLWSSTRPSRKVLEVCIRGATNPAAAAAMHASSQQAYRAGFFIIRTVVYACAGGLFDLEYIDAHFGTDEQRSAASLNWLDKEPAYQVEHVVWASWGSLEKERRGGGWRQMVRVHDPLLPAARGFGPLLPAPPFQPETRRTYAVRIPGDPWGQKLEGVRPAISLATESVYKLDPMAWQRTHPGPTGGPPAHRASNPSSVASRVDYRSLPQLTQRLLAIAARSGTESMRARSSVHGISVRTGKKPIKPSNQISNNIDLNLRSQRRQVVLVDMESLGLWNALSPDSVVLRVATDSGANKNEPPTPDQVDQLADWTRKNWTIGNPPIESHDQLQGQRLLGRVSILQELLDTAHPAISIEALANALAGTTVDWADLAEKADQIGNAIGADQPLRLIAATPFGRAIMRLWVWLLSMWTYVDKESGPRPIQPPGSVWTLVNSIDRRIASSLIAGPDAYWTHLKSQHHLVGRAWRHMRHMGYVDYTDYVDYVDYMVYVSPQQPLPDGYALHISAFLEGRDATAKSNERPAQDDQQRDQGEPNERDARLLELPLLPLEPPWTWGITANRGLSTAHEASLWATGMTGYYKLWSELEALDLWLVLRSVLNFALIRLVTGTDEVES